MAALVDYVRSTVSDALSMTVSPRLTIDRLRSRFTSPSRPTVVFAVGLVVQASILVHFARQYWFAGDDWDMLLTRGIIPGESRGLWDPHNAHVSVFMVLGYRLVFEVFGMKSYLPYAMMTIVLHLLLCILWYNILARVGAPKWAALAGAWILLFLGAGGDALMVSAAMNHLGSLVAALAAVYILIRAQWSGSAQIAAAALCVVSAMFSNTGVAAVFFVATWALIAHRWTTALRVVTPAAAAYLVWYLSAGRGGATSQFPTDPWNYLQTPQLAWQVMSGAMGNAAGVEALGPALLIAVVLGGVLVKDVPESLRQLMWAGLLAAGFQGMILGLSRQWLDPSLGRYSYLVVVFMVPLAAVCAIGVSRISIDPQWLMGAIAGVMLLSYAVTGTLALRNFHEDWLYLVRPWPDRIAGMLAAVDAGERQLTEYGGDPFNGDVNPDLISRPEIRRALPDRVATQTARIDMEMAHMVAVGPVSRLPIGSDGIHQFEGSFVEEVRNEPGCHAYTAKSANPVLIIGTGEDGSEISVQSSSTEVTTQLVRGDAVSSAQRAWSVESGTVHVSTTAKNALMFITFNGAGSYRVCS